MKQLLFLLCIVSLLGCNGNDDAKKEIYAKLLRNRNLSLAYIDSGMMGEASDKLAELERLLPSEAFVYANQGLVALRQNNLEKASSLLKKATSLKPRNPEIALLRAEVAMLTGNFDEAKKIVNIAIAENPGNMRLRWELSDKVEHLQVIVDTIPQNIVARLALIKQLLVLELFDEARNNMLTLHGQGVIQDSQATGLFSGTMDQIDAENSRAARGQVIGLDNVLKPTRAWQHSQLEVAGAPGTVGHPVRRFLNTVVPEWTLPNATPVTFSKVQDSVLSGGKERILLVESPTQSKLVTATDPLTTALVQIDWNNDRQLEVVGATLNGRVYIEGGEELLAANGNAITTLTPWDADQDGDLDLLVSRTETFLLRNNGDGTSTVVPLDSPSISKASIIDIDEDGAVDVVGIDDKWNIVVLKNERSGLIHAIQTPLPQVKVVDLVVGDFNNDGWMDLAWIGEDGAAYIGMNNHRNSFLPEKVGGFGKEIAAADINNDTRLDVVVIGDTIQIFQANGFLTTTIPATGNVQIVDVDLDGDLDVVVNGEEYAVWDQNGTPTSNGFQKIILEAILEGGQRNNALAVGGFVEVNSGGTYQKHLITGPMTHIGLGGRAADTIRVVWPNGVPQEVIEPTPNQVFTEVQILKGSCPFLATSTEDGSWEFVTDLLWRSPLGLKINAQTVPPIAATQDWVKIRGDQLVPNPHSGDYELAITAQLWEAHFIDEIKMIAVDHPLGSEVFVDERFVAPIPPTYQLYAYNNLRSPESATDHNGVDVLDRIRLRDGLRLSGFSKGSYQGIAEDHYVELDLGTVDSSSGVDIVARGWIRPTDTSINVASAQGNHASPKALEVSVSDGQGGWIVVIPNAGFPTGKLKTIVLEIPPGSFPTDDCRVRMSTNLEIYWDQVRFATHTETIQTEEIPVNLISAQLGYMGFPHMSRTSPDAPNIPDYNDIRHGATWRDLEGYYTRYGAVEPLLATVDDRYVIMNAGDAMYLQFEAIDPPSKEMTRDFIFFSDGWVKDGDWNTVDSRTVGPMPHHAMSGYPYPPEEQPEELLQSHADWQEFHTRYITPAPFRNALK